MWMCVIEEEMKAKKENLIQLATYFALLEIAVKYSHKHMVRNG